MLNFKPWKVNFPPRVVEKRELHLFEFLYFCILSAALALLRLWACFDIIIALWVHYGNPWHVEDVSQLGIWKCQVNNKIYNFQGTLGKNIISSQGSRERGKDHIKITTTIPTNLQQPHPQTHNNHTNKLTTTPTHSQPHQQTHNNHTHNLITTPTNLQ